MEVFELITEPIKADLEKCRSLYDRLYRGNNMLLGELLKYIHQSEGKMMRPILALLCSRLFGQVSEYAVSMATAYEFFHNASLMHDDVVDDSSERRGKASVNNKFNNKCAVLLGDYLLAQGLECMAKTNNPTLVDIMSEAAQMLANGELLQLSKVNDEFSEEQYVEIVRCKTAALFRACARSGAVISGAGAVDIENMSKMGEAIGICFQIKDDILDNEIDVELAQQLLEKYILISKNILHTYPESTVRTALEGYIDYVVNRKH